MNVKRIVIFPGQEPRMDKEFPTYLLKEGGMVRVGFETKKLNRAILESHNGTLTIFEAIEGE